MGNRPKPIEGELCKLGRRTDSMVKRWFVLKDSALIQFSSKNVTKPKGKLVIPGSLMCIFFLRVDVIYLNGLYIEPLFHKGMKGFRIYHDSEYFKEKKFFHGESEVAEKWIRAIREHA